MYSPIIPFYKQDDRWMVKSENCYVFDSDHKRYVDFESGDWSANMGHSNPLINQRIKQQVDKLIHDGLHFRNTESEQLSVKLLDKLGLQGGQSVFLNSGSEAVNLGIAIAQKLTRRNKVLKQDCSYLAAYGAGQQVESNSDLVSIPINTIEAISNINFREIAVFVFEPGNSSGLIRYPHADFIAAVASEIKKHDGLLMANEVTTGFGRTGKWFGFQHYDYSPDIVSVGKALGNGYPISGVAISSRISEWFLKAPFRYAQSHQNDALGCAIGMEVIDTIEKYDFIKEASVKGAYFKQKLLELQHKYNAIAEIRARGLMIALEFRTNGFTDRMYSHLLENGILVGCKENTLRFMPPIPIPIPEIDNLINTMDGLLVQEQDANAYL